MRESGAEGYDARSSSGNRLHSSVKSNGDYDSVEDARNHAHEVVL